MKPADEIRQLFKNAKLGLDPDADEKVFEDVFDAHKETTENAPAMPGIWRVIMKSPFAKITAAAVVVLAAYLCLQIPKIFVPPAYALQELPYEQREVICLRMEMDMTFRQIAMRQSTSVNTVKGRYRYGMTKLRSLLNSEVEK